MTTPAALRPVRGATTVSASVVAAVAGWAAISLVATGAPTLPGSAALVAAGLLVSVPHGAVDHLVPTYHGARGRVAVALVAGYLATVLLAWLAWRAWPAPALAVFLLLSAAHFGAGEVAFARHRESARPPARPRAEDAASAAVLGAVVVALPVALHPAPLAGLLAALVPGWDGVLPAAVAVPVSCVVLLAGLVLVGVRLAQERLLEALEAVLLLALAVLAPPAVAIAVYLGGWHSLRHLALLLLEDPSSADDLAAGRLARPVRRLAVRATLPTLAALATVAVLWRASAGSDLAAFVRVDVPLLAALTVPHAGVVWWAERARARAEASSAAVPALRRAHARR